MKNIVFNGPIQRRPIHPCLSARPDFQNFTHSVTGTGQNIIPSAALIHLALFARLSLNSSRERNATSQETLATSVPL